MVVRKGRAYVHVKTNVYNKSYSVIDIKINTSKTVFRNKLYEKQLENWTQHRTYSWPALKNHQPRIILT